MYLRSKLRIEICIAAFLVAQLAPAWAGPLCDPANVACKTLQPAQAPIPKKLIQVQPGAIHKLVAGVPPLQKLNGPIVTKLGQTPLTPIVPGKGVPIPPQKITIPGFGKTPAPNPQPGPTLDVNIDVNAPPPNSGFKPHPPIDVATGNSGNLPTIGFPVKTEQNDNGVVWFAMPSGNVSCAYLPGHYKGKLHYDGDIAGKATIECERYQPEHLVIDMGEISDPMINPADWDGDHDVSADPVFPYGNRWQAGPFTCDSLETGLTCSRNDGHGFHISKADTSVF